MLLRGVTLTLTKRDGGLLTALLALFVTVVGKSFWRLFCFAAHTFLSTNTPQDGLYHQRQAVLRNADGTLVGLRSLMQLAWRWRGRSPRLWIRIIPFICISAFLMSGFYIASLFSSQVSLIGHLSARLLGIQVDYTKLEFY